MPTTEWKILELISNLFDMIDYNNRSASGRKMHVVDDRLCHKTESELFKVFET